jgi:hypothetical protein
MNNELKFSDFTPEELIGKKVLLTDSSLSAIRTITRVTKEYFAISQSNALYSLHTGNLRGGDIWRVSNCSLISDADARVLSIKWSAVKQRRAQLAYLDSKLESLSNEQINQLFELCSSFDIKS